MRTPRPLPAELQDRPFSRAEALARGITPRMLQHRRITEVFPSVYRLESHELTDAQWVDAGQLALPADARLSHTTRLRRLGLEIGDLKPLHFTVGRDLHLAIDDIFLHRTVRMPACDDEGVAIASAFIGAASMVTLLELVTIGDWLLHRGLLDVGIVSYLARRDPWRPGSESAFAVLGELDRRSRSIKESESRMVLSRCGLPVPEINGDIVEQGEFLGCGDLVFRLWKLVVEYEGRQHAFSTKQFHVDIDRYARFRRHDWAYLQATAQQLANPRVFVLRVYDELVRRGYTGPPPIFGPEWRALFEPAEGLRIPGLSVDSQRHSA